MRQPSGPAAPPAAQDPAVDTGVHAMDGRDAAAAWPRISAADLEGLVAQAPALARPLRILWHSPRPFSCAVRVQTARGPLFVKRHDRRVRDAAALLEEHRFIEQLGARGLAVPRLLAFARDGARLAGSTALETGTWTYEIHAPAPGCDAYGAAHSWTPVRSAAHARALGAALARLHVAAADYRAAPRAVRPLIPSCDIVGAHDLAAGLDRFVALRPAVGRFLEQAGPAPARIVDALAPWHAALQPLLAQLAPSWVHNDWHASNAFWTDDGPQAEVCCAIDFGLCNLGWAVADLATALERNTVAWLDIAPDASAEAHSATPGRVAARRAAGRPELAIALLGGYEAVRPLAPAERAALPILLGLAHVEFALSEVDYFYGVLGDVEDARRACPGFLLGHVQWFTGVDGRAYLGALSDALGLSGAPAPWRA